MESLFRHIIVPLDFTQKNEAAIRVALNLAKQNHARVTLIHVIEKVDYANDESMRVFYESLKERATQQLGQRSEEFSAEGVPVDSQILTGKTASCIVDFATSQKADLVVLSSHRVPLGRAPTNWATLSYQVSILCQCAVMLVK